MKLFWARGLIFAACIILALGTAAALTAFLPASVGQKGADAGTEQNPASGQQAGDTHLPPDEAVAACTGKAAGDTCRFTDRDGTSGGICDERPGVLACAPDKGQSPGQTAAEKTGPQAMTTRSNASAVAVVKTALSTTSAGTGTFLLTSDAGTDGGMLPVEYSCDGAGATPALSWSGAPAGTEEFALMMTTIPVDGSTRWNWVLYGIPGSTAGLARNSSGVGTVGTGSHGTVMQYDPPCPQGPGAKTYTFTLYALSSPPVLPADAAAVTGEVLTSAIGPVTLGKASISLSYSRG
jgi:phosphatidylethanolamine-binding protein (PEBP) family uncharacterized protein